MGVVYKAMDLRLGRTVALKFLPLHLSPNETGAEQLLREARATSSLNHPNILTVYDIDEVDGRVFIVNEFVEGRTLREILARRELTRDRAVLIMVQIAEALGEAHSKGVVHRDVKPENIMITPEFRVKVMDFGLALTPLVDDSFARPGMVLGTTQYMAPEQVEGRPVDKRSDIFSLGAVYYEMLCGRTPFEAEFDAAALYAIVNVEPVPLGELNASVPPGLVRVVHKCLAKSPGDRFASCEELLADIREYLPPPTIDVAGQSPVTLNALELSGAPPVEAADFAGREDSRERLREMLLRVRERKGETVLVQGESGIGKTSLIGSVAGWAAEKGFTVLWGRCPYQEPGLPYHPFAVAMSAHFQRGGNQMLDAMALDAERHGIPVGGRLPIVKAFLGLTSRIPEVQDKEQLWEAVGLIPKMLARERPVMIVLDDLQWADRSTIALFGFMARHLRNDAVLLIGMYRQVAASPGSEIDQSGVAECARQLRIDGLASEIVLKRLDRRQTESALRNIFNSSPLDRSVVDTIFNATDGNPLFLVELVNLLKTRGTLEQKDGVWRIAEGMGSPALPQRVNDVIAQRLSRLDQSDRDLLEIASCDGVYFSSDVILGCLGIDRITLLKKLQRLEKDYGLICYESRRYRFDHPLIRQVLYEGIIPELREEYHRTIAKWLIEHYADHIDYAPSIAHHLVASSQGARALDFIIAGGSQARDLCSFENAGVLFEQAGAILSSGGPKDVAKQIAVEEGLGDCALAAGQIRAALKRFESLLELARSVGERSSEVAALRKSGDCLRILGNMKEAWSRCEDALSLAAALPAERRRLECKHSLSLIHIARGEYAKAAEILQEILAAARAENDTRIIAQSLCNLGGAHLHKGEYGPAVELLNEAQRLQNSLGDQRGLATTLNFLAIVNDRLGRYGDALAAGFSSLGIKEGIGDVAAVPGTLNIIGDTFRDAGNMQKAVEFHTRSLALAQEQGNRGSECDNSRDLGLDFFLLGDYTGAERHLEHVRRLAKESGYTWYETRSCITLGELRTAQGRMMEALEDSARGLTLARQIQASELIMEALWKRAIVLRAGGSKEEGTAMLREAIDLARGSDHRNFLWQMYRDLWRACSEEGKAGEATGSLAEARKEIDEVARHFTDPAMLRIFMESPAVRKVMAQ